MKLPTEKVILYGGIAYLTTLIPELAALDKGRLAEMIWTGWAVVWLAPVLSVFIALKALASMPDLPPNKPEDAP